MGVIQTQFCFHWVVVFCVEALNYILNLILYVHHPIPTSDSMVKSRLPGDLPSSTPTISSGLELKNKPIKKLNFSRQ